MSLNQPAVRAFPMLGLLNKSLFDMSVWKQSTCRHRIFESWDICKKSPFNRRTRKIWYGSMELIPTSWQSVITRRRSKPRTIAIGWLLWLRPRVAVWKQLNALHLIQENPAWNSSRRIRPVHVNIADFKISGVVFGASRANNVVIVLQKVWYKRANELVYHQTYAVFHHSLTGTLGIRAWQACPVIKLLNQTRHKKSN